MRVDLRRKACEELLRCFGFDFQPDQGVLSVQKGEDGFTAEVDVVTGIHEVSGFTSPSHPVCRSHSPPPRVRAKGAGHEAVTDHQYGRVKRHRHLTALGRASPGETQAKRHLDPLPLYAGVSQPMEPLGGLRDAAAGEVRHQFPMRL